MKKYRTFIIFMTLFIIFLISLPFWIIKENHDYANLCTQTHDYDIIAGCNWSFPQNLSPQQYYDMYYYNAKNYPVYLRNFLYNPNYNETNLEVFASDFSIAYNTCEAYSSKNQCSLHDKTIFDNVWNQCNQAGISPCTYQEYNEIKPPFSKEQVLLFSKFILHNTRNDNTMSCYDDNLQHFYHQLTDEQKSLLDKRVITICDKKYE
jgi:hypothetical protein